MAKVIYKPGDIIPIVLNVLHICYSCYTCNAFKIAVKDYFPDLKGIIETDDLDNTCIEMLNSVAEGLILLIGESVAYLKWSRDAISNLYGLDADQFVNDKRIMELADDIYYHTTIDGFPYDGDSDDYNDTIYEDNIQTYAMSMMNVVNWLFILIITGETDLELSFDVDHFYLDFYDVDYEKEDHCSALAILKELGVHLEAQHLAIINYVH